MATWQRAGIAISTLISAAVFGIVYYRVFLDELAPLARNEFQGPYTEVVNLMDGWAPVVVVVLVFGILVWFAVGGLQRERKRDMEVRRRR